MHDEAVARKSVRCVGMVQTEELSAVEALALWLAFPHIDALYTY